MNPAAGRSTHYVSLGLLGKDILLATVDEDEAAPRSLGDVYLHSLATDGVVTAFGSEPANLGAGGVFGPASIAVAGGIPHVAFAAGLPSENSNVYVEAWSTLASGWVAVGGGLELDDTRNAFGPSLSLDVQGRLLVAWHNDLVPDSIEVKQWDRAAGWTSIGTALAKLGARNMSLRVGPDGMPVVAWEDDSGLLRDHANVFHVRVEKLNR